MTSIVDESIISDFVAESRDHLNLIEPDLLAMEQGGASQEMLNRVFRAIHSIKGGAGFLAFEALKKLSHAMESVLMLVRDGKLGVDDRLMDALFSSLDRLRAIAGRHPVQRRGAHRPGDGPAPGPSWSARAWSPAPR